ncbi:MAG: DUF4405 domain-containing protein [Lachnospiraceae bacterium]|nr:DUF4405 domain-containing protein [Lachnospiraceae bacterium]
MSKAKTNNMIKRTVDAVMTVLLLFLMAYQVTGEMVHEWIGMGVTLLVIIHQILNRKWYGVLFKGKYNPYRSVTTILDILLLLSFALTAFCGMSMSGHAVPFLYGMAPVSFARRMHLSMSHWAFVLMGMHLGMHIPAMTAGLKLNNKTKMILTCIFTCIGGIGLWMFLRSGMPDYLFFLYSILQSLGIDFHERCGIHGISFRQRFQNIIGNAHLALLVVKAVVASQSVDLDIDFHRFHVFRPEREQTFLSHHSEAVRRDPYDRCQSIGEQPQGRKAEIKRYIGIEHIQIFPASALLSEKDDHDHIDKGIDQERDQTEAGIPACQQVPALHQQKGSQNSDRTYDVQELLAAADRERGIPREDKYERKQQGQRGTDRSGVMHKEQPAWIHKTLPADAVDSKWQDKACSQRSGQIGEGGEIPEVIRDRPAHPGVMDQSGNDGNDREKQGDAARVSVLSSAEAVGSG